MQSEMMNRGNSISMMLACDEQENCTNVRQEKGNFGEIKSPSGRSSTRRKQGLKWQQTRSNLLAQ